MSENVHELFTILHLLLFVYWLGGDLGVYYSSNFVINPKLSNETRLNAAKIMLGLDLIPRVCMTLMLTVGAFLAESQSFEHPTWELVGLGLLAPFWVTIVLLIHFKEGTPLSHKLAKFDYYFRWFMVVAIIASITDSLLTGRLEGANWLNAKITIFGGLIFCGIMIRRHLPAFITGLRKMAAGDSMSDADNSAMAAGLHGARPWVWAIWAGVFIEALLGVFQPGNTFPLVY
jgi:hypothetical protein